MKVFKFLNHEKGKSNVFLIVITIGLMLFVFSILDVYVGYGFAFLLLCTGFGISSFIKIKKASKEIKEIIVEEDNVLFAFFNKLKNKKSVKMSGLLVERNENALFFYELSSNKFIGIAHKSKIIEPELWETLKEYFNHSAD